MSMDIYFVVEKEADLSFLSFVDKYLAVYTVKIGENMPDRPEDYRLIVLWNLRYIIRDLPICRNVVVFHGSDLPKGRGWAPIYHALADQHDEYVLSAIFAAPKVDSGDVVAKARFRILPSYTADSLRRFDEEISVMLAAAILKRFEDRTIVGKPQLGEATYYKRRIPDDSEVDVNKPLSDLLPHLRACGRDHRAFFDWQGCRYRIEITPEELPGLPSDMHIEFSEDQYHD